MTDLRLAAGQGAVAAPAGARRRIAAPPAGPGWLDRMTRLGRKLGDLPGVLAHRRFAGLRRRYYLQLWRQAALALGAEAIVHESGHAGGHAGGLIEIRRGDAVAWVSGARTALDSAVLDRVLADKALSYRLMAEAGVAPVAHRVFDLTDLGPALELLARSPAGIVVKPAAGTGAGRGVTTGIRDARALRRAARHAAAFHPRLIAEPMLAGRSFRLLYLGDRLIDAVRRDPPVVCGNGRDSIRRLMARETALRLAAPPFTALSPLTLDGEARNHLAAQGLAPGHRPAAGVEVEVKAVCNQNASAQNHAVLAEVHPSIAAAGARLMRALGARLAGLDVIAPDIGVPIADSGGAICEINASPGLHHHHLVAEPARGVPVAALVLEAMLARGGRR